MFRATRYLIAAAAVTLPVLVAGPALADPGPHEVVYEVWSDSSAQATTVNYYGDESTPQSPANVPLPFVVTVHTSAATPIYALSAENSDLGAISCRITVDGTVRDEQTAHGMHATVGCTAAS
ncbi:MmpS family transport accessory protein [Nocardia aurantia]|uniref:Uncharacterized protein n=1 Tax=Nocardia aurantia TaxID=2585199 RepID=A0A7K0DJW6_9NOCA|nr:MmpS family transport accessory protein [Nocardia aurantia]MQY25947.1 hypothetical protein [Nocardia aurantia]